MKTLEPSDSIGGPSDLQGSPMAKLRRQWQDGQAPELSEFVTRFQDISPVDLATLIRIDFDLRWRRNERRLPEDYFRAFAAVAADVELAVDIIYDEFLARELSGEQPTISEYEGRFPAFANILARQIQLHHALDSLESDPLAESIDPETDEHYQAKLRSESPKLETSFEILEQIGTGGMGVVYRARQPALNRYVALKMVRAIDANNAAVLARFHSEARVVAALRHPHIIQVHDYGQNDGLPYIAMELVEGGSLADRMDGTPWAPRSAAELLIKLAKAIQFAHERHVVHRDLKPANILVVAEADGFDVKITDFGLAKFYVDEPLTHTKSFAFLGTPSYMAPEQAGGPDRQVGPAADIYSLGAILYELLTGVPPHCGESPIETLRLLITSEPIPVGRIAPQISRDLATICDKCLQRDPDRRYASANEFAADLARYLGGKPIEARPSGKTERVWRWCRRNPSLAGAVGVVGMLLFGIAAVLLWSSTQLNREIAKTRLVEEGQQKAELSGQQRLWEVYLNEASARNNSHNAGQRFAALQSIDNAIALLDNVGRTREHELQLRNAVLASIVHPDIREVRPLGNVPVTASCDLSANADRYLVATDDGMLAGYRLSDGQLLWTVKASDSKITPHLSHDGRLAATVDDQGAKVWNIAGREPQLAWEATQSQFFSFLPGSEFAAYSHPVEGMRLAHARDGAFIRALGTGAAQSNFAYHPETGRLAVCGSEGIQLISMGSGTVEAELPRDAIEGTMLAWHPSGEFLAEWGYNHRGINLWNVKTHTKVLTLPQLGIPAQLHFNDDGSLMASQSLWDRRLCIWDVGTGKRLFEVPEFGGVACCAGADGRILFLTTKDGGAALTELTPGECRALAQSLHTPLGYWDNLSLSPEGRLAAFSSVSGLELWDLQTCQRRLARPIGRCRAEFDREGGLIVACEAGVFRFSRRLKCEGNSTTGPPQQSRQTVIQFAEPKQLAGPIAPWTLGINASAETLVFGDRNGWVLQHECENREVTRLQTKLDPRLSAVSDDNRFAAVANWNYGGARVWDAKLGTPIIDLPIGAWGIVKFSPDGKLLAATPDGVTLWRTSDWQRAGELHAAGSTPTGLAIAFSPDSRVIAVGQINGMLALLDPATGSEWARLPLRDLGASSLAFTADQRRLVASSISEHTPARVWNLSAVRRELQHRGLDLPHDVLLPQDRILDVQSSDEILIDDAGVFGHSSMVEDRYSADGRQGSAETP